MIGTNFDQLRELVAAGKVPLMLFAFHIDAHSAVQIIFIIIFFNIFIITCFALHMCLYIFTHYCTVVCTVCLEHWIEAN